MWPIDRLTNTFPEPQSDTDSDSPREVPFQKVGYRHQTKPNENEKDDNKPEEAVEELEVSLVVMDKAPVREEYKACPEEYNEEKDGLGNSHDGIPGVFRLYIDERRGIQ